jgi:hypothetical protein
MNAPQHQFETAIEHPRQRSRQARAAVAYPLLLLLAVLLVVPSNLGPPLLHDSFEIDWVWADQFTAELARGNLYPRWLPLSNAGLGAPVFYYYPPLSFHLSGLFGLAGFSTYWSIIGAFAAAFAASGIGCWHWLKDRSAHPFFGAAFFMAAPYHLFDYTVRGAQAESVAIAFIPLIAIGLRKIAERRGGVVFTALAYAGVILTHLPLALLVSLFLIAPYALSHRRELIRFGLAAAAGIGLAAIYLIPALALEPYHDVGQLYRAAYLTTAYYSLFAGNWHDGVVLTMFAIIGAIVLAAARPAWVCRDRWAIYAIAVCLLVSGLVPLVWSMPLLSKVQFPYRALPLAEFALATVVARLPLRDGWLSMMFAVPLLLSPLIVPGFGIHGGELSFLRAYHPDVYEYLPRGVMKPGLTHAKLADVVGPRVPPPRVSGMVVEPRFYFPAWSCGSPEPRTQLLMHRPDCHPKLVWTAAERFGSAVSAAFALLIFGLGLGRRTASRKRLAA